MQSTILFFLLSTLKGAYHNNIGAAFYGKALFHLASVGGVCPPHLPTQSVFLQSCRHRWNGGRKFTLDWGDVRIRQTEWKTGSATGGAAGISGSQRQDLSHPFSQQTPRPQMRPGGLLFYRRMTVPVLPSMPSLAFSSRVMRAERPGLLSAKATAAWTLGSMEPGANCPSSI